MERATKMKGKVLITLSKKEQGLIDDLVIKPFQEKGYEVIAIFENTMLTEEALIEQIKDVDGYIVGLERVTEKVIKAAAKLKVICKFGVGTDNIDKVAATARNIKVTNCPGMNSNSVAELVLGVMFSMAREIPRLDVEMKHDVWSAAMGYELTGKTLGIIGLGNIGKYLVKLVQGLHMKILVYDVVQDQQFVEEFGLEYATVERITQDADFVSLHVPLTDATRDLIGKKELKSMKKSAYLINTARGGIVNEEALLKALNSGEIAGAALDAFSIEPPVGSELVRHNKVIALPHIGAATYEATERIGQYAVQNILNVLGGKEPLSEVK